MMIEFRKTDDGSHTLYLKELDEHFHSTFGAVQESKHVFIESGFKCCPAKELEILEIGFGTGLNCLLTLLASIESKQRVRYSSIERFSLPPAIWKKLNYMSLFPGIQADLFSMLHNATWDCGVEISTDFVLHKIKADLLQIDPATLPLTDLVYYDAFSPDKQPELWQPFLFEMLFRRMREGGILVTYCAKGIIRRSLQSAGFTVERIPGPPGKREMIRARKPNL